jgi:acyl-coenzyme A thioesterase PaaI-like protein
MSPLPSETASEDASAAADLSLQERYGPSHRCFGCGPLNEKGLRIKSHVRGDQVFCTFVPEEHHQAFPGMVSGGIIGTLLDCHSNWTAAHDIMVRRGESQTPCTVTAEFHVKLRAPTPSDRPLQLVARVVESSGSKAVVDAELLADGVVTATCHGVFIAVKPGHPAYHRW